MNGHFRFRSLGSGSTGNATLVEAVNGAGKAWRLLVDAGFTLKKFEQRLASATALAPDALTGIFITHEHGDHIGCGLQIADKYQVPIYMSHGTHHALGQPALGKLLHLVRDGDCIDWDGFAFEPFTVPHDAQEPLQLRCTDGSDYLGILTDLGHGSLHVLEQLAPCSTLLLECNYDPAMLQAGGYPPFLKDRIAGRLGHLPNHEAMRIAQHLLVQGNLRQIVAGHLSERNNCPKLVGALLSACMPDAAERWHIADPLVGTDWIECQHHALA